MDLASDREALQALLEHHDSITIVTHINPDVDTIATGLGIYSLLKRHTKKRVEIVNESEILPPYMDFLPAFSKIKAAADFQESLIIACDGGDSERFGIDLHDRVIVNIDHHRSNTHFGTLNIVYPEYASASQVAFELFDALFAMTRESAFCFYAALLSDTRYFTTSAVTRRVFEVASRMLSYGVDAAEVAEALTRRKSLASLRLLERALHSLRLYCEGRVAAMYVTPEDFAATGAKMYDTEGIADYGRALRVTDVGIFVAEERKGEIRVSLRSKRYDVAEVAKRFGGGGHRHAAGFRLVSAEAEETIDALVKAICNKKDHE